MSKAGFVGPVLAALIGLAAPSAVAPKRKLLFTGIGYCPGCQYLRATNSPSCTHCGSAEPVTADA